MSVLFIAISATVVSLTQPPTTARAQSSALEAPRPGAAEATKVPTWRWRWIGNGEGIQYQPGIDPSRPEANIAFVATDGMIHYGRVGRGDGDPGDAPLDEWHSIAPPRGFVTSRFAVSPDGYLYLVGRHAKARRSTVLRTPVGLEPVWQELPVPCLGMLYSIEITSDGTVWLSGERREVFRFKGGAWHKELTPLPYHNFFLRAFDDNTAWVMAETKSVSAIYHRSAEGRWTTLLQKPGDWALLHADRDTACVVTREGLLWAPRPGLGDPSVFPHLLPFDRGEVALSDPKTGWLLEGGVLYRFHGGDRHVLPLESTVYRIRHIISPGDGRLFASDGADGLYILEPSTGREAPAPFHFRPIRHASYAGHPPAKGISVLRMKNREFLYVVDHEHQNPTLELQFRLESTAPLDPFAWRGFAETLRNDGPLRTAQWRFPYDMAAVTADLNGDGLEDIVLAGLYMGCSFFRNVRDTHFVDWTREARLSEQYMDHSVSVVVLDADSDGDLDIFVPNYMVPDRLYLNNGSGRFEEVTEAAGLRALDSSGMATAADLDNDGDIDLVVTTWGRGLLIHENLGTEDGIPRFRTRAMFVDSSLTGTEQLSTEYFNAVGVADLDNDGLEDLVVTAQTGPPRLLRNRGGLEFEEMPGFLVDPSPPMRTTGVSFGDFDHDGDLDLVLTGPANGRYYENRGDRAEMVPFGTPDSDSIRVYTTGSAVLDFEGDGDLDLVLGADRAEILFLQNGLDDGRSIVLDVTGPHSNRSAVGVRVDLYEEGRVGDPESRLQTRRILGTAAYGSSDSKRVHFGGVEHGSRYDVILRLPGARDLTVRGLSPGRHRVEMKSRAAAPLIGGSLFPLTNFLRDRWNLYWLVFVVFATFASLVLLYLLFDRDSRSGWLYLPLALLPVAAIALYRNLTFDPGPLPVAVASALPFVGAVASLVLARSRTRPAPAPDLILSLSDSLRSFRHNETPRRALDSLRMTLNNVPSTVDPTWNSMLVEDLQAYDRIVVPHLRAMARMARAAGLSGDDIEPALRRHRRYLAFLSSTALMDEGSRGRSTPRWQRFERLSSDLSRINDWLRSMRAETDKRLALPLEEVLTDFVATRGRRIPHSLELREAALAGHRVRFRREDLEQVLDVLLDNAVDAVAGAREKVISIRARVEQANSIIIYFMDSGRGIAPEIRDRVFDRGVTGSGKPGRGMGLYYARRIVERFGGRISVVDIADSGACFAIELEVVSESLPEVQT